MESGARAIGSTLTLAIFPLIFFAPGYWLVRRLRWSVEEKLAAAPALSLILIGSAEFVIFALRLNPLCRTVLFASCAALALAALPEGVRFLRRPEGREIVGPLIVVAGAAVALVGLARNFSGGAWYGDWLEHYDRAQFLLGRLPTGATFLSYSVPARPPLINAFAADLMAVSGGRFAAFQVAVAVAGATAFTSCLLMAAVIAPGLNGTPRRVAAWLVTLPSFAANITFPLTKLPAASLVVAGTAFYVASWRGRDPVRLLVAAALLAGGVLAHYSAAPYALFLAAHALFAWRGPEGRRFRHLSVAAALAIIIVTPWFAWSALTYGSGSLVTATSSWRDAIPQSGTERVGNVALNLVDTLTPHPWLGRGADARLVTFSWAFLRDATFRMYQASAPFILGSAGMLLLVAEWIRRRRRHDPASGSERRFWAAYVVWGLVVGVASFGGRDAGGVAHVVLQPLVLLATSALAAWSAGWGSGLRVVAGAARALDALLGIGLQAWFLSYPLDLPGDWIGPLGLRLIDLRMVSGESNWELKAGYLTFLGDRLAPWSVIFALLLAGILAWSIRVILGREPGAESSARARAR
jgi:hypothetical protein